MLARLFILLIAVTCAVGVGWLTFAVTPGPAPQVVEVPAAEPIETVDILISAEDVAKGMPVGADMLAWRAWPAGGALAAGFITRTARPDALETLQGSIARARLFAGEPLQDAKLAEAGSSYMSAMLPAGKRAVAIRISAESTAGGFILPDDRVDVIHTHASGGSMSSPLPIPMPTISKPSQPRRREASRTILTNIKVLAIDQTADGTPGRSVALGKTATLELTPQQAEMIMSAQVSGSLSLTLRATVDRGEAVAVHRPGPDLEMLETTRPPASAPAVFAGGMHKVEILGGGRRTVVEVPRAQTPTQVTTADAPSARDPSPAPHEKGIREEDAPVARPAIPHGGAQAATFDPRTGGGSAAIPRIPL